MRQIADLHIHSRYSRACSKNLTLENIDKTCRIKGVDIIATGDFTFPDWFEAIEDKLIPLPVPPLRKGRELSFDVFLLPKPPPCEERSERRRGSSRQMPLNLFQNTI